MATRGDGREAGQLREVRIVPNVNPYAEGSARVSFGNTTVLCTASVERETPRWMAEGEGGWITAEYGMLPRSTHTRNRREASAGKQGGRTLEIQRLIGRALRRAVDLKQLEGVSIKLDCDVMVADGGTRTAAISGGWVALHQALTWAKQQGLVSPEVEVSHIAAVSVGKVGDQLVTDLCYEEDSSAAFDLNLVFNEHGRVIEIQGTAEQGDIDTAELNQLLELGRLGCDEIVKVQSESLSRSL